MPMQTTPEESQRCDPSGVDNERAILLIGVPLFPILAPP
jgi:hypothetical protein